MLSNRTNRTNRRKTRNLNMKYLSILLFVLFTSAVFAGSTQTNTSGSNTAIEGGYTSTATTTYQSGSSSNSTTSNTTNSNIKSAPPTAGAPSYNSMTQDVCAVGVSMGVQTFGIGVSGGNREPDFLTSWELGIAVLPTAALGKHG